MNKATPTDAAQDLLELLKTSLSSRSKERIIRSFMETEQWGPRDPVDEEGNCLLVAWMDQLAFGYPDISPPSPSLVDLLLDGRPMADILKRRPRRHARRTLQESVLGVLNQVNQSSKTLDFFWSDQVFGAIDARDLEDVEMRGYTESSPANRRLNVLRMALDGDRVEVARGLIEKGWGWEPVQGGQTPALHIKSPEAWQMFLETGGDPFLQVEQEDGPSRPLWRALIEHASYSKEGMVQAIKEWASIHARTSLEEKAVEDYWRKIDFSYSASDVMKAIRSRKDWAEIKNKEGENVLFVGIRKNLSVVTQIASVGKAASLFSDVDHRGAGFWHHLLTQGKVDSTLWKMAIRRANPRPDPEKGMLVVLQTLPEGFSVGSLPSPKNFEGVLAPGSEGAPTAEDWWAGSQEDLTRLGLFLQGHVSDESRGFYWGSGGSTSSASLFSPSDVSRNLSALLHAFPVPEGAPPELLGGLAINELFTTHIRGSDRFEMIDALIEAGAKVCPPPKVAKKWEENLKYFGEEVGSRYQKMAMESVLAPAAPKPAGPSRRL